MASTKYLVIPITPANSGFGLWEQSPYTFRANSVKQAARFLTDGVADEAIELPNADLETEGADITGLIQHEPSRVFAIPTEYPGEYTYFGLEQRS